MLKIRAWLWVSFRSRTLSFAARRNSSLGIVVALVIHPSSQSTIKKSKSRRANSSRKRIRRTFLTKNSVNVNLSLTTSLLMISGCGNSGRRCRKCMQYPSIISSQCTQEYLVGSFDECSNSTAWCVHWFRIRCTSQIAIENRLTYPVIASTVRLMWVRFVVVNPNTYYLPLT